MAYTAIPAASGGGGGGVTSAVAGTGISVSGATGAVTFTNTMPFSADTTVVVSATNAWESIITLDGSTNTVWTLKMTTAGAALATAYTFTPTLLTLGGQLKSGNSTGLGVIACSGESTGIGRPFATTLGLYANGSHAFSVTTGGIFAATNAQMYSLDSASGVYGMKLLNSFNTALISSAGNIQLGASSALATNATTGFVDLPTCAGTPTGTPTTTATGHMSFVVDSTNHILYGFYSAAWHIFATAI